MGKKVQTGIKIFMPVSLVIAGWIAFFFGVYISSPVELKVVLLVAARVLP